MIAFLRPQWLLALPLALALGWAWWRANGGAAPWRRLVDPELLAALAPHARGRLRPPLALAAGALALASLALAGPSWHARPAPPVRELSARIVVLDLSPSMDAVDLAPSRIARARSAAADLLRGAHGARLGLVVFGADAFAAAPLVSDAAALIHLLPGLSPATVPRAGSRPDLGLDRARTLLERAGAVSGEVILVGDSAGGARSLRAARALAAEGFPLSVLALGTPGGGPVRRADGSLARGAGGEILVLKPELAALERLAREGGGQFRLLPADGPTPRFAAEARAFGTADAPPARGARQRVDDGAWLVLLALPFAALLFRRGWLMGLALFALGLASAPRPALAFDWHALWQRPAQQAAGAYAAGGPRERVAALARLAPDSPWRAALLYRAGRYAEAAALYAKRDTADAWYNRANALALEGRLGRGDRRLRRRARAKPLAARRAREPRRGARRARAALRQRTGRRGGQRAPAPERTRQGAARRKRGRGHGGRRARGRGARARKPRAPRAGARLRRGGGGCARCAAAPARRPARPGGRRPRRAARQPLRARAAPARRLDPRPGRAVVRCTAPIYVWSAAALLAASAHGARAAAPDLALEADLAPARVYVGQEARLRLRLLRAPGAPRGALAAPDLGDAATLRPLGPAQIGSAVRAGTAFEAVERDFVLVARRAGRLAVPAAGFEPAPGEHGEARGPALALEVRPIPPGAAEPWLPARRLSLEERWSRDPRALAAGEPVTRTLVIRADGLAAARLPRLALPDTPLLRVRADRPELSTVAGPDGFSGESVQRFVLIPTGDGRLDLPPLRIGWWDVAADAPRSADIPGRNLAVHPAPVAAAPPQSAPLMSRRAALRWIVGALLVVFIALFIWHLRRQIVRDARARLRDACRRSDPHAARALLVEWWSLARPHEQVPLLCAMGAEWDAPARRQLAALDAALYAGRAWDGEAFWQGLRPWLRARPARAAAPVPAPAPLFKLQARAADPAGWRARLQLPR